LIQISAAGHSELHALLMALDHLPPGVPAPDSGPYEELNVFGTPTGNTIFVLEGEKLPTGPRGFTWRPLADRSVPELRARADRYRAMAAAATDQQVADSLQKLAWRFDELAAQRERENRSKS
jgi:hypothetical protein